MACAFRTQMESSPLGTSCTTESGPIISGRCRSVQLTTMKSQNAELNSGTHNDRRCLDGGAHRKVTLS